MGSETSAARRVLMRSLTASEIGDCATGATTTAGRDELRTVLRGVYKGRKASIDPAKVRQMKADGMGPSAIAKALRIGRASVYRALTS